MSVVLLAVIGGLVSFISTSAGSLLAPWFNRSERLQKCQMSMDFALGVMLSAVAFSLVGPELLKGNNNLLVLSGLVLGGGFIYLMHKLISTFSTSEQKTNYKVLLIGALIFHNLPEGMGAGASLAGMELNDAIPLQVALSLQNIVEGLLLTLLLKGLGLKLRQAIIGGLGSGLLEFSGAVMAGFMIDQTTVLLPFLLTLAGGAMMTSVVLEIGESINAGKKLKLSQFLTGMMVIPMTNFLLG